MAVDEVVVPRDGEEPSELVRALHQVIEPLEQRRHAEELIDLTPHLALEKHDGEDVGCDGGHGDDVRPEGPRAHSLEMRDHLEGVEHLAHVVTALQVGRHERAFGLELGHEPLRLLLLVPLEVRAEADVLRDGVDGVGVAIALLPDVQLDQAHAEAVHLADQVDEVTVGNRRVADLDQALVARHQRLQQLILVPEDGIVGRIERLSLAHDHSLESLAGVEELVANLGENNAVRLLHRKGTPKISVVALLTHLIDVIGGFPLVQHPRSLPKLVGASPHGQREDEVLDSLEVQVHGGDAREVHHVAGTGGGDERVTVAIAAHPR